MIRQGLRPPKVEKICEVCASHFLVHNYRKNDARFCSRKCKGIGCRGEGGARLIDLTGRTFGKLTVICRNGTVRSGAGTAPTWLVHCACGNEKIVHGANLRRGDTRSCGCTQLKHGRFGTPEYSVWTSMIQRCVNPNAPGYAHYGGRGISVCYRWSSDFRSFLADMGLRPSPWHSIDRIDNNSNYCPENCRWATTVQQGRNKRSNRIISACGRTGTLSEWSEWTGIRSTTIRERLRHGWDEERAVTTKPSPYTRRQAQ